MRTIIFISTLIITIMLAGCAYDYPEPVNSTVSNRGSTVTEYRDNSLSEDTCLQVERSDGQLDNLEGTFKKGETITVIATVDGIDVERIKWLLIVQEPDGTEWSREICMVTNVSGQQRVRKEYDITLDKQGRYILAMQCMGTNFRIYQISVE